MDEALSTGTVWSVNVLSGAPMSADEVDAPMRIQEHATITIGEDEAHHEIVYGPVRLVGGSEALRLFTISTATRREGGGVFVNYDVVRTLYRPTFVFDEWGTIMATGYEEHDGHLILGMWEIEPYSPNGARPAVGIPVEDEP